jgi:hypothetical protein
MKATLGIVTTLGLVALPFVSFVEQRGAKASLFGWLAFATLLGFVHFLAEARRRSVGVDARQGHFDGHTASGLQPAQQ